LSVATVSVPGVRRWRFAVAHGSTLAVGLVADVAALALGLPDDWLEPPQAVSIIEMPATAPSIVPLNRIPRRLPTPGPAAEAASRVLPDAGA
jgi:hypothetical protein